MNFEYHGIFGADISTYQDSPLTLGGVNFLKMRDYGMKFVIIKAGQGNWKDPDFYVNWHNSKGILPRASYFYYDNRYDPKVQARKYVEILSTDPAGYCWLDLEDRQDGDYRGWRFWYDFLEEFKRLSTQPIGIYTGFYYFVEHFRTASLAQIEYFHQYPLWLASYPADPFNPDYQNILCPPPWDSPVILQTGTPAIGHAAGVESLDIDYNHFNGGAEEFRRYFWELIPGQELPMTTRYEVRTPTTNSMALRPDHNTANDPDLYIPSGQVLGSDNVFVAPAILSNNYGPYQYIGDKWAQVTYGGVTGWVAVIHKGLNYCTLTEINPPTEPEPVYPEFVVLHYADGTSRKYLPE